MRMRYSMRSQFASGTTDGNIYNKCPTTVLRYLCDGRFKRFFIGNVMSFLFCFLLHKYI